VNTSLFLSIVGVAISLAAVGVSAFLVIRQIKFQRHANQVPVAVSLGQEYRSEDFQLAQDYVLNVLPTEHEASLGVTGLPGEARRRVLQVVAFFTGLGGLVFFDIADEEFVVGFLGNRIERAWHALEPYIVQERILENNPDFVVFFEDLVCRIRERGPAVDAYRSKLKRLLSASGRSPSASDGARATDLPHLDCGPRSSCSVTSSGRALL
jgi:hypothetical protein